MPFSSGTFSVYTPGTPYVLGTTIDEDVANAVNTDFATGLSQCVLKDGSQTITANLPMANFKLTGLAAGSALTDSATLQQVQYGFGSFLTSVAGTNTVTGTATPTPAYTVGQRFTFVPAVTNTGAVTLNISSVGAGAVQSGGAALSGGELIAGVPVTVYVTAATPVFEIISTVVRRGSFTATLTGCTASITGTAYYSVTNNAVTLDIPVLIGTSNTTAATITGLPAAIQPASSKTFTSPTTDNGTTVSGLAILAGGGGTITLYNTTAVPNIFSATFVSSGNKGIANELQASYTLN